MLMTSKWPQYLKGGYNFVNKSAHENKKKIYGFSTERINKWEDNLKDWELSLVNHLCRKYLIKFGYSKNIKVNQTSLKKGLSILKKDKFLKKRFNEFKIKKKGNHMMLNDPTNPKNWEVKLHPGKKFVNTKEFKLYQYEKIKLNKMFEQKYYEAK